MLFSSEKKEYFTTYPESRFDDAYLFYDQNGDFVSLLSEHILASHCSEQDPNTVLFVESGLENFTDYYRLELDTKQKISLQWFKLISETVFHDYVMGFVKTQYLRINKYYFHNSINKNTGEHFHTMLLARYPITDKKTSYISWNSILRDCNQMFEYAVGKPVDVSDFFVKCAFSLLNSTVRQLIKLKMFEGDVSIDLGIIKSPLFLSYIRLTFLSCSKYSLEDSCEHVDDYANIFFAELESSNKWMSFKGMFAFVQMLYPAEIRPPERETFLETIRKRLLSIFVTFLQTGEKGRWSEQFILVHFLASVLTSFSNGDEMEREILLNYCSCSDDVTGKYLMNKEPEVLEKNLEYVVLNGSFSKHVYLFSLLYLEKKLTLHHYLASLFQQIKLTRFMHMFLSTQTYAYKQAPDNSLLYQLLLKDDLDPFRENLFRQSPTDQ